MLNPAMAVIECGGVGYATHISLQTYAAIQGKKQCRLYVHEVIREDAYLLYGFADTTERDLFLHLVSVSGIGGATALTMLSSFSPAELSHIIATEDTKLLKSVKGVGLKTAQRVIVELKDKISAGAASVGGLGISAAPQGGSRTTNDLREQAVVALTTLGFAEAASRKVVNAILQEDASITVEQLVKLSLKRL